MNTRNIRVLVVLVATIATGATAIGQFIPANFGARVTGDAGISYDNSSTFTGDIYASPNGREFGDEITLGGANLTVNQIQFEYHLNFNPTGGETGQLNLYQMDNSVTVNGQSVAAPGTLFYQSPTFSLVQGNQGYTTVTIDGISGTVPDANFTWAVNFTGIDGSEEASLLLYDGPTVGSSGDHYWERNALGQWVPILIVPEPSIWQLGLLAGVAWIGFVGYRRFARA